MRGTSITICDQHQLYPLGGYLGYLPPYLLLCTLQNPPPSSNMVHISAREWALRKIDSRIAKLHKKLFLRAAREWTIFLLHKQHEILSHRYYKRSPYGPTYRPKEHSPITEAIFDQSEKDMRIDFRMTWTEFEDFEEMFGGDEVFKRRGKKPQAPAKYQLGLLVYRLAHGEKVHTISKRFGISRTFIPLSSPFVFAHIICSRHC
jgi:hypothetical protein